MKIELTPEFVREWNRIRAKVDGLSGEGITNTPAAITIRMRTTGKGGISPPMDLPTGDSTNPYLRWNDTSKSWGPDALRFT